VDNIRSILQQQHGGKDILLTRLLDGSGAVAVFPIGENGINNAQIIETAGRVRCEVEVPSEFRHGLGFHDAYYVNGELTAIFVVPGRDFAFVINENTGRVIRSYETR
jgi:hypothetical protein